MSRRVCAASARLRTRTVARLQRFRETSLMLLLRRLPCCSGDNLIKAVFARMCSTANIAVSKDTLSVSYRSSRNMIGCVWKAGHDSVGKSLATRVVPWLCTPRTPGTVEVLFPTQACCLRTNRPQFLQGAPQLSEETSPRQKASVAVRARRLQALLSQTF